MKNILLTVSLFVVTTCFGQPKLDEKDINNLVAISNIYSLNPNAAGDKFAKSVDSLRTPKLNHIVDVLIQVGKGDKAILDEKYLSRPSNDELIMWYVIREIHYNRVDKNRSPRNPKVVAQEVISGKTDERWLLDNYYYRIRGGIATLFNETDLSQHNIDIEKLGLKNETEKAIFYFNLVDGLLGGRFKVLRMLKNNDKIIEFASRLPKINGDDYYTFKQFDFSDFDFIGYDKTESYKTRNIDNLYNTLIPHFTAVGEIVSKKDGQKIYYASILHEPKYFQFSSAKADLEAVYNAAKK